jgi:hypothetical protein
LQHQHKYGVIFKDANIYLSLDISCMIKAGCGDDVGSGYGTDGHCGNSGRIVVGAVLERVIMVVTAEFLLRFDESWVT